VKSSALSRFGRRDFSLILGIVALGVTTLLFTFLVLPKLKIYLQVSKSEANLSRSAVGGEELNSQLKQFTDDIELLERRLHGDMASLPEKEIEAHIVGKLQQISWQNNIQLVGVEPSAGDTVESFHEILFRVTLAGSYQDLYQWLLEVGDELGFVLIKQYEMKTLDDVARNPLLSVELTMSTYRALR
jgi:Tfp pilus assembly protein PilO